MTTTKEEAFFRVMTPLAEHIHDQVPSLLPATILIQMANETGWSEQGCWQGNPRQSGRNNWSGISANGQVVNFDSEQAYISAYVQVITQRPYAPVLSAQTVPEQLRALGESPWAASHYGSPPGQDLLNIWTDYGQFLTAIKTDTTAQDSQPAPEKTLYQQLADDIDTAIARLSLAKTALAHVMAAEKKTG